MKSFASIIFKNRNRRVLNSVSICFVSLISTAITISAQNIIEKKVSNQFLVGFTSKGLAVDADGYPRAYHKDNKDSWSFICDGAQAYVDGACYTPSKHKDWQDKCKKTWQSVLEENFEGPSKMCYFGFVVSGGTKDNQSSKTIGGIPLVQGETDSAPGYYISATSATNSDVSDNNLQKKYLDASKIPYIVVSGIFKKTVNSKEIVSWGDIVLVTNKKTGNSAFAIVGDGGKIGEGSVKLLELLNHNPFNSSGRPKIGLGEDNLIEYIVFPNSRKTLGITTKLASEQIQQEGKKLVEQIGEANIKSFFK